MTDNVAAALAGLPPLRETIAAHGLDARKRLGQHFLLDLNLTRRIARAGAPLSPGTVVEVGPGPGGLTRALLLEGATNVVAVEVDTRAITALQELQEAARGCLKVIEGDALDMDLAALGPPPRRIVANLPYNVSTALLVRWLHAADEVADMVLMFQKEVVDRLVASPRTKDYGRLSVLAQHVCTVQRLFDVAPSAFVPPPKVVSSVARLRPRPPGDRGRPGSCSAGDLGRFRHGPVLRRPHLHNGHLPNLVRHGQSRGRRPDISRTDRHSGRPGLAGTPIARSRPLRHCLQPAVPGRAGFACTKACIGRHRGLRAADSVGLRAADPASRPACGHFGCIGGRPSLCRRHHQQSGPGHRGRHHNRGPRTVPELRGPPRPTPPR